MAPALGPADSSASRMQPRWSVYRKVSRGLSESLSAASRNLESAGLTAFVGFAFSRQFQNANQDQSGVKPPRCKKRGGQSARLFSFCSPDAAMRVRSV